MEESHKHTLFEVAVAEELVEVDSSLLAIVHDRSQIQPLQSWNLSPTLLQWPPGTETIKIYKHKVF